MRTRQKRQCGRSSFAGSRPTAPWSSVHRLSFSGCHRSGRRPGRRLPGSGHSAGSSRDRSVASRDPADGVRAFRRGQTAESVLGRNCGADGRQWHYYRLVCKRMRVEWGPRRQLQQWIAEYHPVAIFSFGTGLPARLPWRARLPTAAASIPTIETPLPPSPAIVDGGPAAFHLCARPGGVFARFPEKDTRSAYRRRGPLPLRGSALQPGISEDEEPAWNGVVLPRAAPGHARGRQAGHCRVRAAVRRGPARNMAYGQSRGGPFTPGRRIT